MVSSFVLVDPDDHDTVLFNTKTKQDKIFAGRLVSDLELKTLQANFQPCSWAEGGEVRGLLRYGRGAKFYEDSEGKKYGTGRISKAKGYAIPGLKATRQAVELINDVKYWWYLERGGDANVKEHHKFVNEAL